MLGSGVGYCVLLTFASKYAIWHIYYQKSVWRKILVVNMLVSMTLTFASIYASARVLTFETLWQLGAFLMKFVPASVTFPKV